MSGLSFSFLQVGDFMGVLITQIYSKQGLVRQTGGLTGSSGALLNINAYLSVAQDCV